MLHRADHPANSRRIVVDGNIIRAAETQRLNRALVDLKRIVDRTRLLYENFFWCCHNFNHRCPRLEKPGVIKNLIR